MDAVRFTAMLLSPQEAIPYDVMSAVYAKPVRSLATMLQEGGLALSAGATWFIWIDRFMGEDVANAHTTAKFAAQRQSAVRHTHSANPIAVLPSETAWRQSLPQGNFDWKSVRDLAFSLQDQGYCVDIVNEAELRQRRGQYQAVLKSNSPAQVAVPPTVSVEQASGNPRLVFSLRSKGRTNIVHVTDLTSFVKTQRVEPNSSAAIDPNQTIAKLEVSLAYPARPHAVTAVPATTTVAYQYRSGRLYLTFRNLTVHAAALVQP